MEVRQFRATVWYRPRTHPVCLLRSVDISLQVSKDFVRCARPARLPFWPAACLGGRPTTPFEAPKRCRRSQVSEGESYDERVRRGVKSLLFILSLVVERARRPRHHAVPRQRRSRRHVRRRRVRGALRRSARDDLVLGSAGASVKESMDFTVTGGSFESFVYPKTRDSERKTMLGGHRRGARRIARRA